MYSFKNDYSEGAHPRIVEAMVKTNMEQSEGYGLDTYSNEARSLIKKRIGVEDADIHFLVGGTQANLTCISAFLKPYEAAIGVSTAHVLVHETGAIEATGHKVISVEGKDGKVRADDIEKAVNMHTDEHMVKPKLVYISDSTEIGTIYKLDEIKSIREACDKNSLYLYIDGARLGSALTAEGNDMDIKDIARYADAFYIGGTKNGALIGEAVVICNDKLKEDFRFNVKQRGAMLAKGRIIGIQFLELFKDNLYFDLARYSNDMAGILKRGIKKLGYKFMIDTATNQIFPILPDDVVKRIGEKYEYTFWQKWDDGNTVLRLVTSWATDENMVHEFLKDLSLWSNK